MMGLKLIPHSERDRWLANIISLHMDDQSVFISWRDTAYLIPNDQVHVPW